MTRWRSRDAGRTHLAAFRAVPTSALRKAAEQVAIRGADPWELYRKWERQHWSVADLDIAADRAAWDVASPAARDIVASLFTSFFIGEYTAVDGLAAVLVGAPDEDDVAFLGTQCGDEARHVALMNVIDHVLLDGVGGLRARLPRLWADLTPGYRALQAVEDAFAADVLTRPDLDTWLRLVSVFHLLTEGVLAINGQQAMIRTLRRHVRMPAVESGFIAMMRDEARHIAYGTGAARRWVARGYEEHVVEAMELAVPHVVHIDDRPGAANSLARNAIARLVDRRLASVGLSPSARAHVAAVARRPYPSVDGDAVAAYETAS